MNQSSDIL